MTPLPTPQLPLLPGMKAPRPARLSGILTWLAAVGPLWWRIVERPELLERAEVFGGVVASLVFGAGFLPAVRRLDPSRDQTLVTGLVQVAAGLTTIGLVPFTLPSAPTPALLTVVALPQFVYVARQRLALAVILVQTLFLWWIYREPMQSTSGALVFTGSALGFQLFGFSTARLVMKEARAKAELATTLDELRTTQAVLVADERLGERVRIARDLHDAIGHHLTTLSLQLDLARRQDPDTARDTVGTAHSICRVLLAELRDVLSDIRSIDADDLRRSIEDLVSRVPDLQTELEVRGDLHGLGPESAQLMLRSVQEAITNVLRHADASRLQIALDRDGESLLATIRDDGRGFGGGRPGGGLEVLGARLLALGGALDVEGAPGHGTTVTVRLPLTHSATGAVA